jgi:hypothetical protein
MIHQFAELGQFYLTQEGVAASDKLSQFACNPAAKFRSKEILLLVFSIDGFQNVHVEEYDDDRRLRLLYRFGTVRCYADNRDGDREKRPNRSSRNRQKADSDRP